MPHKKTKGKTESKKLDHRRMRSHVRAILRGDKSTSAVKYDKWNLRPESLPIYYEDIIVQEVNCDEEP